MTTHLWIFDLDGTLSVNPSFYSEVYSGTLTSTISGLRGEEGLRVLASCREQYEGKGELALHALNIPYRIWARALATASLDLIEPSPELVKSVRSLDGHKVVYTGSPLEMSYKHLERLGFEPGDFSSVLGWQEPENHPIKWTCSPHVFENLHLRFAADPSATWAVGDTWDTDLMPAKHIGIRTAQVGHDSTGSPDVRHEHVLEFLAAQ